MKKAGILLGFAFATAVSLSPVFADSGPSGTGGTTCTTTYGGGAYGGQNCQTTTTVVIDKTVKNPQNGVFVDNLGSNDPKFAPDSVVPFQIVVRNTGNTTLSKITVKDILPQFTKLDSGPGSYNPSSRTLSFDVNDFKAGETRTFNLTARVLSANDLPADQGIVCMTNNAQTVVNNVTVQDNAQFCVEKQVLGGTTKGGLPVFPAPNVTSTPPTGPEAMTLLGLIPSALAGFALRKKASK